MMPTLYLALLLFHLPVPAAADDQASCEAKGISDFRDTRCMPPRRSQTDSSWCYAYAAAEILSFEVCRPISAPAVAMAYVEKNKKVTSLEGWGRVVPALESAIEEGLCLEEHMPSTVIENGHAVDMVELYKSFSNHSNDKKAGPRGRLRGPEQAFPGLNRISVMKAYWSRDKDAVFSLKKRACKQRIHPELDVLENRSLSAKSKIDFIEHWIRERPVVFSADARHIPVDTITSGQLPWKGSHTVTIVARVWNRIQGSCGFWLRDSDQNGPEDFTFISRQTLLDLMKWDPGSSVNAVVKKKAKSRKNGALSY